MCERLNFFPEGFEFLQDAVIFLLILFQNAVLLGNLALLHLFNGLFDAVDDVLDGSATEAPSFSNTKNAKKHYKRNNYTANKYFLMRFLYSFYSVKHMYSPPIHNALYRKKFVLNHC